MNTEPAPMPSSEQGPSSSRLRRVAAAMGGIVVAGATAFGAYLVAKDCLPTEVVGDMLSNLSSAFKMPEAPNWPIVEQPVFDVNAPPND